MQLVYRIFYHPLVNQLFRNLFRLFRRFLPPAFRIPVAGKVRLQISPDGRSISLYTNPTNSMTKLVYWDETNSHEYTDVFIRLLPDVDVFVDIGASIGYYSIVAKTVRPDLQVYAFEPADGPFHYLQKNISHNRFDGLHASQVAISDQAGTLTFYQPFNQKYAYLRNHLGGDGSLLRPSEDGHLKPVTVRTQTLDAWVAEHKLDRIDLIKMDTEGTEDRVLRGGTRTIQCFRPVMVSEVLYNRIEEQLDQILADLNYVIFKHGLDGPEEVAQLARSEDDGVRNCFFVPKEKREYFISRIGCR